MSSEYIVVYVTASSEEEGAKIAKALLEKKAAACVNMVPAVESYFWWDGKVDQAREALLVIKSRRTLFKVIERIVKDHHSYDVPEIIALPIVDGQENYLQWISESVEEN